MDNLKDLLPGHKFIEPKEIKIIKKYMHDKFQSDAGVEIKPSQIVISVQGAALAGTLRLELHELAELCKTDKRLVIRIG